ncbi:MAG: hypothetical protein ACJA2N_002008 [Salibacteraceae bacterium]|jgi:uncharacterized protein (TIGR00290 family)
MESSIQNVIFSWSGGKDAAMALFKIKENTDLKIQALLTTINKSLQRVTMHGVPLNLTEAQAKSIGIPLEVVELPENISMVDYTTQMNKVGETHKAKQISKYIYGDINLADLKRFRDTELDKVGIEGVYPLWNQNTKTLAQEFLSKGFKAVVVAVNSKLLNKSFVGRDFDQSFLNDLPEGVDFCGENGEFHTFVYDGPIFTTPIAFKKGAVSYHTYQPTKEDEDCFCCDPEPDHQWDKGFWFCDLQAT